MNLNESLLTLKKFGFAPKFILDIGAYKGEWTDQVSYIFPTAGFLLVEPNDHEELSKHQSIQCLLSDTEKIVDFYSANGTGDSYKKEATQNFKNVKPRKVKTRTLDSIYEETDFCDSDEQEMSKGFDLIKIDAQGAELDILEGGKKTLSLCDVLILELPFAGKFNEDTPTFAEHISYLDKLGFVVFDFAGFTRWERLLFQIDIVFIKKDGEINKKILKSIEKWGS
tara:strand:- start:16 stop:690 length:675 start_codon:yes stop_codon:yes gene_type:complete